MVRDPLPSIIQFAFQCFPLTPSPPFGTGTNQKPTDADLIEDGKFICSELKEGNSLGFTGLLMVLVIALTLMAICFPPPPRRAVLVARRFG
ncbi:hypothetical protein ES288_D08G056700v1 [Gossypium darwinii]|uniref:Uncharacterized protein n=1 Tax=Gossypium darwinii TaxID=34276 RepID=A0A5D2BJT2_GOSDA|nr:hypothetical protein ES288_D08G056700v1 [Gossypium darwinii]